MDLEIALGNGSQYILIVSESDHNIKRWAERQTNVTLVKVDGKGEGWKDGVRETLVEKKRNCKVKWRECSALNSGNQREHCDHTLGARRLLLSHTAGLPYTETLITDCAVCMWVEVRHSQWTMSRTPNRRCMTATFNLPFSVFEIPLCCCHGKVFAPLNKGACVVYCHVLPASFPSPLPRLPTFSCFASGLQPPSTPGCRDAPGTAIPSRTVMSLRCPFQASCLQYAIVGILGALHLPPH